LRLCPAGVPLACFDVNVLIYGLPRLFGMKVKKNKDAGLSCIEEKITLKEIWAIFQETDKKIQETGRLLRQNQELTKELQKDCNILVQTIVSSPLNKS
jgi:trans-2-enoyl-CoA reductase